MYCIFNYIQQVDEIMSTLKQAFKQAHHSYQNLVVKNPQVPKIIVCDSCPMNWFHMLCSDIEGMLVFY